MFGRAGIILLVGALAFGGDASARSRSSNRSSPIYRCYRGGTEYAIGGYCVSKAGVVEVCISDDGWMSVGPCRGDECRAACPG